MSTGLLSVEEIRNRLTAIFDDEGLQFIIVFGSAASGKVHSHSDIDLAFQYNRPVDVVSLTNKVTTLLHTDKVDVVDLRRATPLLMYSVAKTGKLLYEKAPNSFVEFCSLAFRRYVDTGKLREAQRNGIRQFLESRGLV